MTIGQRIAHRRKELGLSQEALGAELGVSRQAVYKWESDAALPDIDKLIALSKRFDTTIGALLGVEEPNRTPETPDTPESSGELTETQMQMVEEIVRRYTEALPKPVSRKRRRIFKIAAAAAILCLAALLWNLFDRLDRLNTRYMDLQNQVAGVQTSVAGQIDGIAGRVEELLQFQNSLTADFDTEILSADLAENRIRFSAYAVPRTYQEGMTAEFVLDSGGHQETAPGTLESGQTFTAAVEGDLTDAISLSVIFTSPDGTRQTQLLDQYSGLWSASLPCMEFQALGYQLLGREVKNGALTLPAESLYFSVRSETSASAANAAVGVSDIRDFRAGLFRNQTLVTWLEECAPPDGAENSIVCFRCPPVTLQNLTPDDTLCFAAIGTDEYGREIVFPDIPYIPEEQDGGFRITWPDSSAADPDPARWTY